VRPVDPTLLSRTPEREEPVTDRLYAKCDKRVTVGGDSVVREVAANDVREPRLLLGYPQVHPLAKLFLRITG
jgi:hypothetical protein